MASEDVHQSLFGSPTPSRSPSPTLALPGVVDDVLPRVPNSITHNVGTIALPGSQSCSELPKDPLAFSLKYPIPLDAYPDLSQRSVAAPSPTPSTLLSCPSTPLSCSRTSSIVSSAPKPKKRKRIRKGDQPSPAPSITLPDPSTPLPPNFLRNQMALLGTAGVVAGIKPANLAMKLSTSRGSTPTNPIFVDHDGSSEKGDNSATRSVTPRSRASSRVSSTVRYDEYDAPRLGKRSGSMTPSSDIDPTLLPAPTNREIVSVLIGQKDIFPVLQNILRLIAGQKAEQMAVAAAAKAPLLKKRKTKMADAQAPGAMTRTPKSTSVGSKAPPLKRRKLNRVPAGAGDWDVPYPFQEGEGPEEYSRTWEKERGKQLIAQLINLIRAAARKAATKKYLLQQEAPRSAETKSGHIVQSSRAPSQEAGRLETLKRPVSSLPMPQPTPQQPEATPDVSAPSITIPPIISSRPFSSATPSEPLPETSLDQLISSLLAACPTTDQPLIQSDSIYEAEPNIHVDPSTAFVNAKSGEDVNDDLINSWMNVFETFPIPPDGFVSVLGTSSLSEQQLSSSISISSPGPTNFDFFDITSFDSGIRTPRLQTTQGNSTTTSFQSPQQPENALQQDAEQFMRDIGLDIPASQTYSMQSQSSSNIMIDPTLLAISQPQPRPLVDVVKINTMTSQSNQNPAPVEGTSGAPSPSVPSPIPSASSVSSVGDVDPSTPTSALWESSMPDIVFPQNSQDPSHSQAGGHQQHEDDEVLDPRRFTAREKEKWKEKAVVGEDGGHYADMNVESGRAEREPTYAPPASTNTPFHALMGVASIPMHGSAAVGIPQSLDLTTLRSNSQPPFMVPSPPLHSSTPSGRGKLDKQGIIRRAQERRKQLVEELKRVKVQLWETTIEQGVLVELQNEVLL